MNIQEIFQDAAHMAREFPPSQKVLEAGFRFEARPSDDCYPNGWCLVYRNSDNKPIGRVEQDDDGQWNGRYFFFGGGTTFGGFPTRWVAALWVLKKNSGLGEGWDEAMAAWGTFCKAVLAEP